jgi:hypothetical protein
MAYPSQNITLSDIIRNEANLYQKIKKWPVNKIANRVSFFCQNDEGRSQQVLHDAQDVRLIYDREKVLPLLSQFIQLKQKYGTVEEKKLFNGMSIPDYVLRLLTKRPLVCYLTEDTYLMLTPNGTYQRDGGKKLTDNIFTTIQEKSHTLSKKVKVSLSDYISSDERLLSALLGIGSPTFFINNGDRKNSMAAGEQDTFQERGVFVGLIGSRLENNLVEGRLMLINKSDHIQDNGYGANNNTFLYALFAQFYNKKHIPTFQEIDNDFASYSQDYIKMITPDDIFYLDKTIYKQRIRLVAKPFLEYANSCAEKAGKKGHVRIVGLGLGCWLPPNIDNNGKIILKELQLEVYKELLGALNLQHIAELECIHFTGAPLVINKIEMTFSTNAIAAKIQDENKLLIAQYAWDGSCLGPGNEYWLKAFSCSGDPAAACCSLIISSQNPLINPSYSINIRAQIIQDIQHVPFNDFVPQSTQFYNRLHNKNYFFKKALFTVGIGAIIIIIAMQLTPFYKNYFLWL